jgi:hypothetical protein
MLAIGVWLGGLAFFGIVTAPFLFRIARAQHVPEIAPQMVTAMLGRFTYFTYVCAALLILVWLAEGAMGAAKGAAKRWWVVQGSGTVIAAAIAFYLGAALFPQIVSRQPEILPVFRRAELKQSLTPEQQQIRAEFDRQHQGYNKLASISVWVLVATLVAFSGRTVVERRLEEG